MNDSNGLIMKYPSKYHSLLLPSRSWQIENEIIEILKATVYIIYTSSMSPFGRGHRTETWVSDSIMPTALRAKSKKKCLNLATK